ncbi:hypothetical protein IMZ31_14455 [Pontibacillus sp. ALD_SL1]|nr:hypothetical protein [Pontibacillus sp. ALD_SL1]QSS99275.1 hypothetical protein IMZ31_14455 [Pontibacillus sp. ALD_SL1]
MNRRQTKRPETISGRFVHLQYMVRESAYDLSLKKMVPFEKAAISPP